MEANELGYNWIVETFISVQQRRFLVRVLLKIMPSLTDVAPWAIRLWTLETSTKLMGLYLRKGWGGKERLTELIKKGEIRPKKILPLNQIFLDNKLFGCFLMEIMVNIDRNLMQIRCLKMAYIHWRSVTNHLGSVKTDSNFSCYCQ